MGTVKGILLFLAALALPGQAQQTAGVPAQPPTTLDAGAHLNPMKIAQLKWYIANSSTNFPVGSQPYGLCFDGANIWVANNADHRGRFRRCSHLDFEPEPKRGHQVLKNSTISSQHRGAGPRFQTKLMLRLPRPCLCVLCRDRAGILSPC